VQAELQNIGRGIAAILQENFVGFYITGSFTMGAWNPQKSDLDFLVVVKYPLSILTKIALEQLHSQLALTDIGKRLEGGVLRSRDAPSEAVPYCCWYRTGRSVLPQLSVFALS